MEDRQTDDPKQPETCAICHDSLVIETKPAGAGYADDLAEYAWCSCDAALRAQSAHWRAVKRELESEGRR